jgi:hypothetical protein
MICVRVELVGGSLSVQPPPPLVVLVVEVSQHLGKLQQGAEQGDWGGWWEVSLVGVCCAMGFPPEVLLAAA